MILRVWNPKKRFIPVELSESGSDSTGMESGNRFVHVEISENGNDSTGIESEKAIYPRRTK